MSFNFQIKPQNHTSHFSQQQQNNSQQTQNQLKTKLTKKFALQGFILTNIDDLIPAKGTHKYQISVQYMDPESEKTKRADGARQKIIKFGQKGRQDFVDAPHSQIVKDRQIMKIKSNTNNPLHPNFYVVHLLNGPHIDIYDNLNLLKRNVFKY